MLPGDHCKRLFPTAWCVPRCSTQRASSSLPASTHAQANGSTKAAAVQWAMIPQYESMCLLLCFSIQLMATRNRTLS